MAAATISDVARSVGVSESTVSRCISGHKVRKEKQIRKAIEALDYRPNQLARNLKSGRTGIIAVIVPDVTNPFFASIVQGVEAAAGDSVTIQLINTGDSIEREVAALRRVAGAVDGCIFVPAREDSDALSGLNDRELPLVFVDRMTRSHENLDAILASNEVGGYKAAAHLIEHGHTAIATISGPFTSTPGRERTDGFKRALRESGLDAKSELICESDFSELGGYSAMNSLLNLKRRPTAVFVANNLMTVGALKALKERSISIPDQIAIIGFDDLQLSELIDPPLSVISRDAQLQGSLAMATLKKRMQVGDQFPLQHLRVDVELIRRGSCGSTCRHSDLNLVSASQSQRVPENEKHN